MLTNFYRILLCVCCFIFCFNKELQAQKLPIFNIVFSEADISIKDAITVLESQGYIFSYSNESIDTDRLISIKKEYNNLSLLFKDIFSKQGIKYELLDNGKILLLPGLRISAIVIDQISQESIKDAIIINIEEQEVILPNSDGFFFIETYRDSVSLRFRSLAFQDKTIVFKKSCLECVIPLSFNNYVKAIDIVYKDKMLGTEPGVLPIRKQDLESSISNLGGHDLMSTLQNNAKVHSGGEMINGIIVKGGSTDQNLILMDGMPIYEFTHMGGLSSIFLKNAIKKTELISSGFHARYGGRLSSILDVQLNEGNKEQHHGEISVNLSSIDGHIEGPLLKGKTSYSIAGRQSWLGAITRPIFRNYIDFDDLSMWYYDGYAKLSHQFSESNRLNLSYYKGEDLIEINQLNSNENFLNQNKINWGNQVMSLTWAKAITDNIFLNLRLGNTQYNYNARNTNAQILDQEISNFLVVSDTDISDTQAFVEFNYYSPNGKQTSVGFDLVRHKYLPRLSEFSNSTPPVNPIIDSFNSIEYSFFINNELQFDREWSLKTGLRWTDYRTDNRSYQRLSPRVSLDYSSDGTKFRISSSLMHQFVHLLINPGPGLPSDLWVPVTDNIGPKRSAQLNVEYQTYIGDNFNFEIFGYLKNQSDLLEYEATSDVFYSVLSNTEVSNVLSSSIDWQDRVVQGSGQSIGAGVNLNYKYSNKFLSQIGVGLSNVTRQFDDIDVGETYNYKYNRPLDLRASFEYHFANNFITTFQWTYGTGYAFTLPVQSFVDPNGNTVLIPPKRNNLRFSPYHHLDARLEYQKVLTKSKFSIGLSIFNAYNRANPFYVYLRNSDDDGEIEQKQLSVFPIIPNINCSYTW